MQRYLLQRNDGYTLLRPSWYTQNELAARLGTVTDVIQRSLRKLEADKLIEVGCQQIRIINRDGLEQLAS